MATAVDATASDSLQAMLSAYRNVGDPTGANKKEETQTMERQETTNERMARNGKNDTAVYVDLSVTALKKSQGGAAGENSAQEVRQRSEQS
ncbi:MAG: hypothetical protein HQL07_05520 [Nitrospirae bacterium]|nr:hypothetical protein [Magnetococcales bacterium]HAT50038.1 hypothetical protein [Alphaproteobacteria bacterium]